MIVPKIGAILQNPNESSFLTAPPGIIPCIHGFGKATLNGLKLMETMTIHHQQRNRANTSAQHKAPIMNVGNIASMKSMAQEAMETAAATKAEAAKGDQQAIRKLASQSSANSPQNAPPANIADEINGRLDVKA